MSTRRLFLALWPDAAARQALVEAQDGWRWAAEARRVPAGQLHLTLHFIGSVADERVAALEQELELPCPPVALPFGRCEAWGNGVAALCPLALPPGLAALHRALAERLLALGHEPETRPWRPHVTLARRALGSHPVGPAAAWTWPAAGYALVESRAGYHVLREYGCASATMRPCTRSASSA